MDDIYTFRIIVEQLEICKDLIKTSQIANIRIAYIILDNLVEVMMYRRVKEMFEEDDFYKQIIPSRFPDKVRSSVLRFYDEKIKCIEKNTKLISKTEGIILRVAHDYRNGIFHKDAHNPSSIQILSMILFKAVCSVFRKYYNNGHSIGGISDTEIQASLSKYDISINPFIFSEAATHISKKLMTGLSSLLPKARKLLSIDIESRIHNLKKSTLGDTYLNVTQDSLDFGLKWQEFLEVKKKELDAQSQLFREMRYKVGAGKGDEIDRDEYLKEEDRVIKNQQVMFKKFTPSVSLKPIDKIKKSAKSLNQAKELSGLLVKYRSLDEVLSRIERYADKYMTELERFVQHQVDLARGK